jgi:hypothetical protein
MEYILPGFITDEMLRNEFSSNDIVTNTSSEDGSACELFCRNHICRNVWPTCEYFGPNSIQCRRATQVCLNCYNGCYEF